MTTSTGIDGFCSYMRDRGLASETVRRRLVTLQAFGRFLGPMQLGDATGDLVEEFLVGFRAPATRRAYRADLVAFYRWAVRRRLLEVSPMDEVERVRVRKALPRPVPVELVDDLIMFAPDHEVRLAIALAAYAGLRLSEAARLHREDVTLTTTPATLVVRCGKGGKDRVVPVHPALAELLPHRGGRLIDCTPGSLGRKVAGYMRGRGVNATMHQLRHTFGTEAARASNGNLLVVAEMMGHESLETTAGYTRLAGVLTASTIAAMYPAAA